MKEDIEKAMELLKSHIIIDLEDICVYRFKKNVNLNNNFKLIKQALGNGVTSWCIAREKVYLKRYYEYGDIFIIITPEMNTRNFKIVGVRGDGVMYDSTSLDITCSNTLIEDGIILQRSLYDYLQELKLLLQRKLNWNDFNLINDFLKKHIRII